VGVGEHRVAASADGLRRGVVGRSRGVARGGGVRPGCACGPTRRGWAACVTGAARVWVPRDTGAGRAQRHEGVGWARSSPWTDLDNPSGARIGGGVGGAVVAGTLPGGRAGPPSSWSSRNGWGRHVTRRGGCVAVGGSAVGRGVAPQPWTAHPRGHPQNISIRASKGMTCPNLREIGSGRGRGFSLVVFPTPLLLV